MEEQEELTRNDLHSALNTAAAALTSLSPTDVKQSLILLKNCLAAHKRAMAPYLIFLKRTGSVASLNEHENEANLLENESSLAYKQLQSHLFDLREEIFPDLLDGLNIDEEKPLASTTHPRQISPHQATATASTSLPTPDEPTGAIPKSSFQTRLSRMQEKMRSLTVDAPNCSSPARSQPIPMAPPKSSEMLQNPHQHTLEHSNPPLEPSKPTDSTSTVGPLHQILSAQYYTSVPTAPLSTNTVSNPRITTDQGSPAQTGGAGSTCGLMSYATTAANTARFNPQPMDPPIIPPQHPELQAPRSHPLAILGLPHHPYLTPNPPPNTGAHPGTVSSRAAIFSPSDHIPTRFDPLSHPSAPLGPPLHPAAPFRAHPSPFAPPIHHPYPTTHPRSTVDPAAAIPPQYQVPQAENVPLNSHPANQPPHLIFGNPTSAFAADPRTQRNIDPNRTLAQAYLQEHMKAMMLDPKPVYIFDGSKPEGYFSWLDSFRTKIAKAGCEDSYDDILLYLRAHLDGEALAIYSSFADTPITTPYVVLTRIMEALNDRYGSAEVLTRRFDTQVKELPFINGQENDKSISQIRDLLVVARRISFTNFRAPGLLYEFYTLSGISRLSQKMPKSFQLRWRSFYLNKKEAHQPPPTLEEFIDQVERFLREVSEPLPREEPTHHRTRALATRWNDRPVPGSDAPVVPDVPSHAPPTPLPLTCPLHLDSQVHPLVECPTFVAGTIDQRLEYLQNQRRCFRCAGFHFSSECTATVGCSKCRGNHDTVLCERSLTSSPSPEYPNTSTLNGAASGNGAGRSPLIHSSPTSQASNNIRPPQPESPTQRNAKVHFKNSTRRPSPAPRPNRAHPSNSRGQGVRNMRTDASVQNELCLATAQDGTVIRNCSKTLPVLLEGPNGVSFTCLAILDEQSQKSFVDPKLIDLLNLPTSCISHVSYSLTTLGGNSDQICGQIVSNLRVRGVHDTQWINLPPCYTNPNLPDTSNEIAGPEDVLECPHIKEFAPHFPPIESRWEVLLLIGVDCSEALQTSCFGERPPYVHRTALGYTLVGPVKKRRDDWNQNEFSVCRTTVTNCDHFRTEAAFPPSRSHPPPDVFIAHPDDDLPGISQADQEFIRIVASGVEINQNQKIQIPLPFKRNVNPPLNKFPVFHRTNNTLSRLTRDEQKALQCREIMKSYLERGHVKALNDVETRQAHTFIPVFPILNQKKNKIRLVFDSSARFQGVSLNDCLHQGPDETNRLLGVILRFRHHEVAFCADVESMFHCFDVPPEQQKYLCFFWWKDNIIGSPLVPHAATVHIFGNTCSPSIATYGLRYATIGHENSASHFIRRQFYVDDGLRSEPTVSQAVETLSLSIKMLHKFNIRLHKIASTHTEVLQAFPESEIATNVDHVDLQRSTPQSALGIRWSILEDCFHLESKIKSSPFTKRGVLSVIGSLFDPLGIIAPIVLRGKLLHREFLREPTHSHLDWDDPLPLHLKSDWDAWVDQLRDIPNIKLRRSYRPRGFGEPIKHELHTFADASVESIGVVAYIRQLNSKGDVSIAFVQGSSKVAPKLAVSVPRMELCAAVHASEQATRIIAELDLQFDAVCFYTDSKVVLGYIHNRDKTFTRYVTSRVSRILNASQASQWYYVESAQNPADIASRVHTPKQLTQTIWLTGPDFLRTDCNADIHPWFITNLPETQTSVRVLSSKELPRDLPECQTTSTIPPSKARPPSILVQVASTISCWKRISRVIGRIMFAVNKFQKTPTSILQATLLGTELLLIHLQAECFGESITVLRSANTLPTSKRLANLSPWIDDRGLMRVGSRLRKSEFPFQEIYPIILPPKHPVTFSILAYHHQQTSHQGRIITSFRLKQAGFHILNSKRVITSFLNSCTRCKRLRGALMSQKMAELPADRLQRIAPFERSGLDVFGPYHTQHGRTTRKSDGTKKTWVLLFTCLYSRAVHLEVLSSMDTTTFILAFRRFLASRGSCYFLRSDRGTNFVGANNQLNLGLDFDAINSELLNKNCVWEFNPPRASHMAGVWERKVGSVKKVLNAAMQLNPHHKLTAEEFLTFVKESEAIVNSTQLSDALSNPDEPHPISPAMLLNLRDHPTVTEKFSTEDLMSYGKRRWKRVQFLADRFWQLWKMQYLTELQFRTKWLRPTRNLVEGDVVLVKEPSPRPLWPLAMVHKTLPGSDGLVRRVIIRVRGDKINQHQFKQRAIHDLVLLVPAEESPKQKKH